MLNRAASLVCSLIVSLVLALPAVAQTSHWLTGYYATYNYGVMSTSQLDYTKLTHVIYWPVIPSSSSPGALITTPFGLSPTTFANGAADIVTRAHAAGAKALLGIGGDVSSGATAGFQISTTSKYQAAFISNIVALIQQYGFDGVDINWEQIQTSDNSDFTSFIANLRAALTSASPNTHLLLTMPPETKPNGGRPDLLALVYQDLDQINIQTYQMSGPYCGWETWFNSPLNNGGATFIEVPSEQLPSTTNAIADYTSVGIPPAKLAMGIQFDSSVWTGGQGTSTGGVSQPKQTWTNDNSCSSNPAAPSYNTLPYRTMITTLATTPGYTTNFDSTADQSWLSYDPSGTGTTNESQDSFVSFDSPASIAKKGVDMSASAGVGGTLGGVFIFELSGDYAPTAPAAQQHPLLNAAHSMQMLLPGLITGLKATAATGSVTLNWTAATGASSYNVAYATNASGPYTAAPAVTTNQATINNLTAGQEYWSTVQAVNAFGTGLVSPQVTATIPAAPQTITFPTIPTQTVGTPLTLSATATSGLPVSFSSSTTGVCTVSGATAGFVAAGTCTITASQPGNGSYAPATPVTQSFAVNAAGAATAAYLGSDTTTQGTWTNKYGSQGQIIANDLNNPAAYAAVSLSGDSLYTWAASTTNVSALQTASGASTRLASTYYSSTGFTINLNLTDGNKHKISLYLLDWLANTRAETITVSDANTNVVLNTQSYATFGNGVYAEWNISGHVLITVTKTGGVNAVVSAIFFDPQATVASAAYIGSDTSTQGTWTNKYGAQGQIIANDLNNPAGYATVSLSGDSLYTWAASTTNVSALQTAGGAATRIASTYYSTTSEAINLNLTDANTHKISLYLLDWLGDARSETITVSDANSNAVLSTQSYATFENGVYAEWNISGHVLIKITKTGGLNAVVSGIFFDQPQVLATATVTLSGLTATYTGSPIAASAATSPAGLAVSIAYAGSTTAPTNAGSYFVVATVTGAGYSGSATGTLVIAKATPVITWPTPAPITSGTALSATQLDAGASVPGTFVYSPAAGTTPAAGTDILSTTFTPTDTTDYNTATAKVSLTVTAATNPRVVWIPDFYGSLLQVRVGTTPTAITINLPSCNPNAVAVNNNKAYVVCSAYNANPDKILVYNATTIRAAPAGTLSISPLQTITSSQFNSLIGITFDSSNNLWVASYGNSQIDSISAATLNTASPVVTPSLVNSPGSPVSMVFDSAGGLWVVGQYVGGILLHFPLSQINAGANANPDYCLATANVGSGCQYINNVFLSPAGVALYGGDVWVANNSTGSNGTVPGRELVDLKFSGGMLTVNATFGASGVPSSAPFVCPGGLYASSSHLWVTDESYGETNPACGANGDVASMTGGVFSFTPQQLANQTTAISQVLAFSNITGRPGFGGIFVEND